MLITPKSKSKHLVKKGFRTSRFDLGKYKWTGTVKDYYGMEVPDFPDIVAVYPEQRRDSHGDFVALVAVHK